MNTPDTASAVNSPNMTKFIEEISLVIVAQDLSPAMMSYEFLKFSGIISQDWELAQQPVLNPSYAQLNFTNGVSINAQPRTINLSESLGTRNLEELVIQKVAANYVAKLPHAEYMGLSLSPKILLPFPEAPESVRQYITGTLLGSGSWKRIGRVPVQAGINLMYLLDRCQLTISVSEAKLQKPQEAPIMAILFSGNFNYNVDLRQNLAENRTTQMRNFINNWQTDLEEFRAIVDRKFLDADDTDSVSSIGEVSLFPGQTL